MHRDREPARRDELPRDILDLGVDDHGLPAQLLGLGVEDEQISVVLCGSTCGDGGSHHR
jgi:hypothetical protein